MLRGPGCSGRRSLSTTSPLAPAGHWAATWFDGSPNLTERATLTTSGFATQRSQVGSRVAYDPLTGRPVAIWSQSNQIVSSG